MSYYLDTSAIRQIGAKLPELAQKTELKASVLGQMELLSRAGKEESYDRCKAQLHLLSKSGIQIDDNMPEKLTVWSFDYMVERTNFKDKRVPCLKKLVEFLLESSDCDDFKKRDEEANFSHPLEFWEIYDDEYGKSFNEAFVADTKMLREVFKDVQSGEKDSPIVPGEILEQGFSSFCGWFMDNKGDVNFAATVNALAHVAANYISSPEAVAMIHDSYNGTNSAFVDAMSRLSMYTHMNGGSLGRNDALDLAHFLYVKEGSRLVTADVKMARLSASIGCPVYNPETLIKTLDESG